MESTGPSALSLGGFSVSLGHAFLDSLGSAVHQVLGFLQAQAGDFAHSLNHRHLVGASFGQDHVEFGLLSSSSGTATTSSSRSGHGGSAHAKLFFDGRNQVVQLHHGHAVERGQECVFVECHFDYPNTLKID